MYHYTRNIATVSSHSYVAIILIYAQQGVLSQTKRHCFIVNLLGIKHVVVAINNMDLFGYYEGIYNKIVNEYKELSNNFSFKSSNEPISSIIYLYIYLLLFFN